MAQQAEQFRRVEELPRLDEVRSEIRQVPDFRAGGMQFLNFVKANEKKEFNFGGKGAHRPEFRSSGNAFVDFIRTNYMPKVATW